MRCKLVTVDGTVSLSDGSSCNRSLTIQKSSLGFLCKERFLCCHLYHYTGFKLSSRLCSITLTVSFLPALQYWFHFLVSTVDLNQAASWTSSSQEGNEESFSYLKIWPMHQQVCESSS